MEKESEKLSLNLEASAAKSLFLGQIVEENLFPYPKIDSDEAETVRVVLESIDKFLAGYEDKFSEYDKKGEQPQEFVDGLKELGLFGVIIPEEYGGIGLSSSAYARVLQQTSRFDSSTSLTIGAHSSIGMKGLLLYGTEEQKQRYLPALATGELVAAFCLTEPGAGSDAASLKTRATKNDDGSWTLSGEKIWITNGPIGDFYTVFARTDSEGGKLSAFIVERGLEGVSTGPKEEKMGIRASSTSSVIFENVRLSPDALLGEEGKGFKIAMNILNNGRTGLGGGSVGGMKTCIALAAKQAFERKQFGKRISEFGLIKQKLGRMAVRCFASESVVGMLGNYVDCGNQDFSTEAAISKVFVSEALWDVAHDALQIAGGNGFMQEYPYERIVRDARIGLIYEGTNEILRLYIALSGMKEVGANLKELASGLGNIFNDPIKGFGVLSSYATRKIGQLTSLGRDRIENVNPALRYDAAIYEQYTQELTKTTELLLRRHGKKIIDAQLSTERVANVAIDLFVGLCVMSRVSQMVEEKSAEECRFELGMSRLFAQGAKRRMNQALRRVERNEDETLKNLSDHIVENEGYRWDLV